MAINIPGTAFQGITSLGTSAPDAGFYEVSIVEIETAPNDKPGTRRFHVQFDNGFKMFTFVSLAYDDNGNMLQGLAEKQVRGRMAALRTILESLGYTGADFEDAAQVNDGWFLASQNHGRKGYVEFIPGQKGVEGSFSEIKTWLNKSQYEAMKASGNTPATNDGGKAAAPVVSAAPIPPAASSTNGAPSSGVALPPPVSAAQGIVS